MEPNRLYSYINRVMGKYFYVFGLMIILMSCGKDIDLFIPKTNQSSIGDISRLTSRLQSDIAGDVNSSVSCPCSGNRVFALDKDLVLSIPADFVDLTKYPCSQGHFDIDVTVCDTKGEILVAGIPTVSENKLLESRMELNLQIKDGNTQVKLADGKPIRILINDPDPRERMELFYGDGQQWIQADGNPDTWNNVVNNEWYFQQENLPDPISGFGYECFSDSLDWINVDVFFQVPSQYRTPVSVKLPEEFTNTNTAVFMAFDDYKSILAMRGDSTLKEFIEPESTTPIGFRVTFIVISEMGEDSYFFASKSTVITPGHTETLIPKKTPYEEIRHFMKSL